VFCTQVGGGGNVQGAIYNASTNALLATTSSVALSGGYLTLSFSSSVSLTAGGFYYLALACNSNGSDFAGQNIATALTAFTPYPAAFENNNPLPATFAPSSATTPIWIQAL
jgi:hypothetical protein